MVSRGGMVKLTAVGDNRPIGFFDTAGVTSQTRVLSIREDFISLMETKGNLSGLELGSLGWCVRR